MHFFTTFNIVVILRVIVCNYQEMGGNVSLLPSHLLIASSKASFNLMKAILSTPFDMIDFLNRRAFENWTTRTEADLRGQVVKFLDSVMGPNKLIERFKVMKIEQDPNQKDHVLLDIHITPYFPAKSFVIQLAGHKGDNPEDAIWESEYHQE